MMTKRHPAIVRGTMALTMALLLVGLGSTTARAKTTLRWKYKEGEVLRYSMDQNTVSVGQDLEGREVKQTIGLIMDMTWTVKSVDASGVASITQTIDRLRTSATAPFGKFSFDSKEAGTASGAAGPLFKMLVGAEFSSKMNPKGEVTDIKLSDKVLATLRGDNEPAGAQGQFSEAGLKNMIAQMVMPLPDGGVEVGETWGRKITIPAGPDGQTRKVDQTFTYKGAIAAPNGLEAVEFTTKFEAPKADPNVPVTFKKETATGRYEFDNAAGRVVKSTVLEDVEVSIAVEGKEVAQKVETSRVLTLSKD
jgi:hypothetical protein